MAKHFLFSVFHLSVTAILVTLARAQSQSGFKSIDCGYIGEEYKDKTTGISYSPDNRIDTGEVKRISSDYKAMSPERQFENLRSFPQGNRNCYKLNAHGNTTQFLIRTRFMYGNYDGQNHPPKFDIYVGVTWWDSVEFENAGSVVNKEIIYVNVNSSENILVCLCNINKGTPFISALELRPLEVQSSGPYPPNLHLAHVARFNLGSQDKKLVRYPDDDYDRIWTPYNSKEWKQISTSHLDNDLHAMDKSYPPSTVMRTAITPANESENIRFYFKARSNVTSYLTNLYYQDFQNPEADQPRDFRAYVNGQHYSDIPKIIYPMIYNNGTGPLEIWLNRTGLSTLPPLLNAIEIFTTRDLLQNRTNEKEYDAMTNIKLLYGIQRNWQGDPCAPLDYIWDGIKCHYHQDSGQHRIVSLDLSSSGLKQVIAPEIGSLSSIEYLDLSNNSLTDSVPDFLSQLPSLRVLKLDRNQLSGTIPSQLLQKSKNGSLDFSFGENPNLCYPGPCKKRPRKMVMMTLVATLGGALILFVAITFWIFKTKQSAAKSVNKNKCFHSKPSKVLDSDKQEFTYEEVQTITNKFRRVLGEGGFGTVYHGQLGNTEVAVKMLSFSALGYQQFQAEAELLTKVHHKCLTSLIGYCDEGTNVALIYEYMSNGDLSEHLSGKSGKFLRWKERLQIAVDAAEGLEYLHNGCKPPIIHRDIKPQNILLNENMHGKLGDFGLSRIFSDEDDTHVSTVVAGTRGYLDPEYFMSNRLNEKSDVFSFGIVLLEIITGQPAIAKTEERTHITEWLDSMLREREVDDVVDSRLHGEFCTSSVRKTLDTAMSCVKSSSINRPTMTQVLTELKECLSMEMSWPSDHNINIPNSINDSSIDIIIGDDENFLAR